MQQIVFLLVASGIGLVVFKLRSDAARERKSVMARLAEERTERGDYSPTAELFREATGNDFVPTYERLSDVAAAFPPPPADDPFDTLDLLPAPVGEPVAVPEPEPESVAEAEPEIEPEIEPEAEPEIEATTPTASDLRTLYRGIAMPAGLKPLGPLAPEGASFVTAAPPADVHAGLDAEFDRLGCATRWVEPTVAQTERNGERGLVTIYPNPLAAIDLDGEPMFPEVTPGHVVVRMLAL